MNNGTLIADLSEHGQYARLHFMLNGKPIRLDNLESKADSNGEDIILNFKVME